MGGPPWVIQAASDSRPNVARREAKDPAQAPTPQETSSHPAGSPKPPALPPTPSSPHSFLFPLLPTLAAPDLLPPAPYTPDPGWLFSSCPHHVCPAKTGASQLWRGRVSHAPGAWAGITQAPHSSPAGKPVAGAWGQGPWKARGHGSQGHCRGQGPGAPPASGFLLLGLAPVPRRLGHLSPPALGDSLGPGLAGLVVAWREVSWGARGTVCNKDSRTGSAHLQLLWGPGCCSYWGLGLWALTAHGPQKPLPAHIPPTGPDPDPPTPILADLLEKWHLAWPGVTVVLNGEVTACNIRMCLS